MAYPEYMDYYAAVARGEVDASFVHKFGNAPNVSTTAYPIWSDGGAYTYLTTAKYLKIGSDSVLDIETTGTGARTVSIQGLDASYNMQEEQVTLNGFTGVTTASQYLRLFRIIVNSAGSLGFNNGKIVAYPDEAGSTLTAAGVATITSNIQAQLDSTTNQTLMAIYTVPASYTAYLISTYASSAENNQVDLKLKVRPFGEVFQTKEHWHVFRDTVSIDHKIPVPIAGKSDIQLQAQSSASSADVTGGFDLLLCKE